MVGTNPKKKDKEEKRKPDPKEPFCGLVFKIVADTHGDLFLHPHLFRHAEGQQPGCTIPAATSRKCVSKLYHIHADPTHREELPEAVRRRHRRHHRA